MDVVFVLDLSGSIEETYNIIIAFSKKAIYGVPVGFGNTRVGVVGFSDQPYVQFDLNTYTTEAQVRNALSFKQAIGTTNTQAAIQLALSQVFPQANPNAKKIMVIVTDGNSNVNQANTIPSAQAAQSQNIKVISVGIGSYINQAEIQGMASSPVVSNTFYVPTSNDVDTQANNLLNNICQA